MATTGNRLSTQTVFTGDGTIAAYAATSLQNPGQLGQFVAQAGNLYQLVQLDSSAVTSAAGQACVWIDQDDFIVTNDISDSVGPNLPAGVILNATVAASGYCFIQVRGTYATVKTDGGDDIAAGDAIYVDPSVDGVVDSTAAGTAPLYVTLGVATAADVDANDTVSVMLNPPLNREF